MRVNCSSTSLISAALLGLAMGSLVFGFALFFMPSHAAVRAPQPWIFAALTAVLVTLTTAKPFTQIVSPSRS